MFFGGGSCFFMTVFGDGSWKKVTRILKFSFISRAHEVGAALFSDAFFGRVTTFSAAGRVWVAIFRDVPVGQNTGPPPCKK